ncbi:MAG: hypothetical protein KC912_15195 [Proteobacteria bacterium]|nr:hypothetical protein [Pseudomonadota bacterium]
MSNPGFFETLTAAPQLGALSKYTVANGLMYLCVGTAILFMPADWLALALMLDGWQGYEEGWARMIGFTLAVVGWFYVMGGRTGAASFGLATVVDRAIVPFAMLGLWATGKVAVGMVIGVGILDPLLGLGAYLIWRRETTATRR